LALRAAATSGDPTFFLGTDSAPHLDPAKESACGCAGCFTATNTLSILAEVFEQDGALDKLSAFVSENGPRFYRLPVSSETVTLTKGDVVTYPDKLDTAEGPLTLFDPMMPLHWRVD